MGNERHRPRVQIRPTQGLEACIPEYLDLTRRDVDAAIADGSLAAWQTLGHNLKGSAASFGFDDVEAFGRAIENHARQGSAEQALECALALREYLVLVEIEET
jgi:HPt (histidine-containing phosphotransfer) domain-containing protein